MDVCPETQCTEVGVSSAAVSPGHAAQSRSGHGVGAVWACHGEQNECKVGTGARFSPNCTADCECSDERETCGDRDRHRWHAFFGTIDVVSVGVLLGLLSPSLEFKILQTAVFSCSNSDIVGGLCNTPGNLSPVK